MFKPKLAGSTQSATKLLRLVFQGPVASAWEKVKDQSQLGPVAYSSK